MKYILLLCSFLLVSLFLVAIILRLPEYYSFTKSYVLLNSDDTNNEYKALFFFEDRKGKDSMIVSLKNNRKVILPDYYGKQDFAFDLDGKRWYPNTGFFKFKKWHKYQLFITIKHTSVHSLIINLTIHNGFQNKTVIDTLLRQ